MKKNVKIALIASAFLVLAGLVCIFAALSSYDFKMDEMVDQKYKTEIFVVENWENVEIIKLNETNCDITFYVAEDNVCRIEYPVINNIVRTYELDKDGKVLINSILDNRHWYEHINIVFNKSHEVKIYLPEKKYQSLKLNCTSGDINISKEISFNNCEITTTSGDIEFSHSGMVEMKLSTESGDVHFNSVRGGNANIQTTSGDIRMGNITNTSVFAYSTSGDISVNNSTFKHLNAKTTSGDIKADKTHAEEWVGFNSTSGDINAYDMRCGEIHYISVSGDIKFDMVENTGTVDLETTSGDINGNLRRHTRFSVETTSGNTRIVGNDNNSDFLCTVKTVSGDIDIKSP